MNIVKAAPELRFCNFGGLKVNRSGMACCPFHNDRHPSMKLNEDYFYCFSYGAAGDVIDLVARLYNVGNHEAAQRIAADFGFGTTPGQALAVPSRTKRPYIRQFREDEMLCFRALTDYLHLLEDWKVHCASKTPEDELDALMKEGKVIFTDRAFFAPEGRVTDDISLRGQIYAKLKYSAAAGWNLY